MKKLSYLIPVLGLVILSATKAHASVEVPEPTSLLLVGSGIAGVLALWRKFK